MCGTFFLYLKKEKLLVIFISDAFWKEVGLVPVDTHLDLQIIIFHANLFQSRNGWSEAAWSPFVSKMISGSPSEETLDQQGKARGRCELSVWMKILTTHKQADVFVASNDTETRTLLLIIIIHNELTNFVQHLLQLIIRLIASRYLPRLLERNSMRNLVEGQRSCFYRATVLEVFWFFHLLSQKWFLLSKTKSLTFNVHVCFCYKIACQRPPRNTLETLDQKNCFEEQNILGRLVLIIKSNSVSSPKSDSQWNSIQKSRLLSKVFALGRYF